MWVISRIRGSIRNFDYFNRDQKARAMKRKTPSERQRNLEKHYGPAPRNFRSRFANEIVNYLYWTFRRLHYFLCFYDNDIEVDLDDLLSNPFNSQPPSLDSLQQLTGFQKPWLAFFYRNFKQLCSNGRMHRHQLRAIFRIIFKGAADSNAFADRIFSSIVGNRSTKQITFEDLIMCLYDLTQSFRTDLDKNHFSPSTTSAQFTFSLMQPDEQGRVDFEAFLGYVKCIVDLNASLAGYTSDAFGLGSSGLTQNDKNARRATIHPWLVNLARQQFITLDRDNDGYIRLDDIEALFAQRSSLYEPLVLRTESEFGQQVSN